MKHIVDSSMGFPISDEAALVGLLLLPDPEITVGCVAEWFTNTIPDDYGLSYKWLYRPDNRTCDILAQSLLRAAVRAFFGAYQFLRYKTSL